MITTQATMHPSGLATVPAAGICTSTHIVPVPSGACPVSRNPILGVAILRYEPVGCALEVVALTDYMRQIVRPLPGHPRNVEGLAARIAVDAGAALGCPVSVELILLVWPLQILRVRA